MAYYDEGFREKMEGVAGGLAKQLNKNGEEVDGGPGAMKGTAQLEEGEQTTMPAVIDAGATSEDVEPATEAVSEASGSTAAPEEEPSSSTPLDGERPSTVKIDSPEPADSQVANTSHDDTPVSETKEQTVGGTITDVEVETEVRTEPVRAEPETETEKPSNSDLTFAETEQPLEVTKEVTDAPPQEHVGEGAREKVVEAEIDQEKQDIPRAVVEEDGAGIIVESMVTIQELEPPNLKEP